MLTTADGPSSGRGDRARAGRGGKAHRNWRKWQQLGLSESEKVAMVGGGGVEEGGCRSVVGCRRSSNDTLPRYSGG